MTIVIIFSVAVFIVVYKALRSKPKSEWTEWEHHRDTTPLVTRSATGEGLFQNQAHWVRYNSKTQSWETKIVTDPIKRPFNQATSLSDVYNLRFR